jgi:hypothetical protein
MLGSYAVAAVGVTILFRKQALQGLPAVTARKVIHTPKLVEGHDVFSLYRACTFSTKVIASSQGI